MCHRNRRNRTPGLADSWELVVLRGEGNLRELSPSTPGRPSCFRWTRESAAPSAAARAVSARDASPRTRRVVGLQLEVVPRRLEFERVRPAAARPPRRTAPRGPSLIFLRFPRSPRRPAAAPGRAATEATRSPKEATMVAPFCAIAMTLCRSGTWSGNLSRTYSAPVDA